MKVLLILMPISVGLAAIALWACILSIRNGQYKDTESPKWRVLFDSTNNTSTNNRKNNGNHQV